ncbi:MAG: hypothetical protein K2X11_07915, partial [Acetobacteraceae bacterium]|nr:hypothetical protein [Acetobacteraceae bacterium]
MTASALRRRPLALPAPRPGWTPRRAELPAWAGSLLLHGLAAGALLGLVGLSRPPAPPAPIAVELL